MELTLPTKYPEVSEEDEELEDPELLELDAVLLATEEVAGEEVVLLTGVEAFMLPEL